MWATVGIHPHDAAAADEAAFAEIERLAADPRVVAMGEIGLDFFRNLSPPRRPGATLPAPARPGAPARQARGDALPRRPRRDAGHPRRGAGGRRRRRSCTASRATWPSLAAVSTSASSISLAGPVTYPNARALPDVARFVPADRLVVETDCPFLPPQGLPRPAQRARVSCAHRGPRGRAARRAAGRLARG